VACHQRYPLVARLAALYGQAGRPESSPYVVLTIPDDARSEQHATGPEHGRARRRESKDDVGNDVGDDQVVGRRQDRRRALTLKDAENPSP
jgi:hypothetical protein